MSSLLEALEELKSLLARDVDPHSGRLWSYVYETGVDEIRGAAEEAYRLALWRNMLDPTVFPSVLEMERAVVGFVSGLFNAPETAVGNFTRGGTESNFMAVLAARENYYRRRGRGTPGRVLAYSTVHPSVAKAAWILGLRLETVPVGEDLRGDPQALLEHVTEDTVAIVLSAPEYPFGMIDPVRGVAEAVGDKVWVHVDSCLGFSLPLLEEEAGVEEPYDFRVEGVDSISVDLHKLGYAPRGSSVIVYRDRSLRLPALYVYSRWPGYPLVNQVFLSSRTAGPLAASYVLIRGLGVEGYRGLAMEAWRARQALVRGMESLGFRVLGDPRYLVVAFTHDTVDLVSFSEAMARRGWHVQVQPGSRRLGYPMSLHYTVTPVHSRYVEDYLRDAGEAIGEAAPPGEDPVMELLRGIGPGDVPMVAEMLASMVGEGEGGLTGVSRYVHELDPQIVEELFRWAANLIL